MCQGPRSRCGSRRCGTGVRGGRRIRSQVDDRTAQRVPGLPSLTPPLSACARHLRPREYSSAYRCTSACPFLIALPVYDVMPLVQAQVISREGIRSEVKACSMDDRTVYCGEGVRLCGEDPLRGLLVATPARSIASPLLTYRLGLDRGLYLKDNNMHSHLCSKPTCAL